MLHTCRRMGRRLEPSFSMTLFLLVPRLLGVEIVHVCHCRLFFVFANLGMQYIYFNLGCNIFDNVQLAGPCLDCMHGNA